MNEHEAWADEFKAGSELVNSGSPELFKALEHGTAAVRRFTAAVATLTALEPRAIDDMDAAVLVPASSRAMGEASEGILSLFLATDAVTRFCEDGPCKFDQVDLEERLAHVTRFRDAVMHWDDKLRRDPKTFLAISLSEAILYAPPGRLGDEPARIDSLRWEACTEAARLFGTWAGEQLGVAPDAVEGLFGPA